MRTIVPLLAAGMLSLGAACAGDGGRAAPSPCAGVYDDAENLTDDHGVVRGFASPERSNLVVMAKSSAITQTMRVDIDDERVVEVDVPGMPGCTHPPVLSFGFELQAELVEVHVAVGRQTSTAHVSLSDAQPTWLTVSISEAGVTTSISDTRPVYG